MNRPEAKGQEPEVQRSRADLDCEAALLYCARFVATAAIPNRAVFRAQEVCEIADVQPYVLRSWEAEFADLGVAKTPAGPRVYRRADVERVLRLKHLLFVDGLTLAGARKQLLLETGAAAVSDPIADADVAALLDAQARQSLIALRGGLEWILRVLSGTGQPSERGAGEFALRAQPAMPVRAARKPVHRAKAKPVKKAGKSRKR